MLSLEVAPTSIDMVTDTKFFNFRSYGENVYGYVHPGGAVSINRLGAADADDHVDGVLAIWVATNPEETGSYIVGWYANATVYRNWQAPPPDPDRHIENVNEDIGYYVTVLAENAVLLPSDERLFWVPNATMEPFGMGIATSGTQTQIEMRSISSGSRFWNT